MCVSVFSCLWCLVTLNGSISDRLLDLYIACEAMVRSWTHLLYHFLHFISWYVMLHISKLVCSKNLAFKYISLEYRLKGMGKNMTFKIYLKGDIVWPFSCAVISLNFWCKHVLVLLCRKFLGKNICFAYVLYLEKSNTISMAYRFRFSHKK
jgi:hypothetical protein